MSVIFGSTSHGQNPFISSESGFVASEASTQANAAARNVSYLGERFDKLLLVCMSLWELLKERTDLTEEDLLVKVGEIDLRDGRADGKITQTIKKCPKCDRTMSPRHQRCLYCGAEELNKQAFDAAL